MVTSPRERLLPSLLDRLRDDAPHERAEARERRAFSMADLRRAVRRDLECLFNTVALESVTSLDEVPELRGAVVNFGLPALSGNTPNAADRAVIRKRLRDAIVAFEPRILPDTLRVVLEKSEAGDTFGTASAGTSAGGDGGSMVFRIEGMLWGQPLPEALFLRTEVDLDRGDISVAEA